MVLLALHAMEEKYTVIVEHADKNITRLNLAETNAPTFCLGTCALCAKKVITIQCEECHGVNYCSLVCQEKHNNHKKKDCHKIKQAKEGHLARIEGFFQAYIMALHKTKRKEYVKDALTWHRRLLVRVRQDMACSNDRSTDDALANVHFQQGQLFKQLIDEGLVHEGDLTDTHEGKKSLLDAVAWAEELTKNDTLVSPHGIVAYGLECFLPKELTKNKGRLISQDQWKAKRLAVLDEYKTTLTQQS